LISKKAHLTEPKLSFGEGRACKNHYYIKYNLLFAGVTFTEAEPCFDITFFKSNDVTF
jgi:hypothetical protein